MSSKENKCAKKTMEKLFKGYTFYSEEEYKDIWNDSLIIVDTNILLNLYRYSDESRKEIISLLKTLKDKIWIPYQVAKEYFKNRDKVIKDSSKEIEELKGKIDEAYSEIDKVLRNKEKNYTEVSKIEKIVKDSKYKIAKEFDNIIMNLKENDNLKINFNIEREILSLINNNIGEEPSEEAYLEMIQEGEKRINDKIPPGYKDNDKKERYKGRAVNGDFIVFKSFMNYAKEKNKNVIFITDDVKEDWFQEIDGERKGGRPELLHEFYSETNNLLLIYSFEGFANKYNKLNPGTKLSEEVISEINEINIIKNENFKTAIDSFVNDLVLRDDKETSDTLYANSINEIFFNIETIEKNIIFLNKEKNNLDAIFNNIKVRVRNTIKKIPEKDSFVKKEIIRLNGTLTYSLLKNNKSLFLFQLECLLDILKEYYDNYVPF